MHHTKKPRLRPSQRPTGAQAPDLDSRAHAPEASLGVGGDTQLETPRRRRWRVRFRRRGPADSSTASVVAPKYLGYPTYLGIGGVVPRRRSEPANVLPPTTRDRVMSRNRRRPEPDPGVETRIEPYRRRGPDNHSESVEVFLQELREGLDAETRSRRARLAARYPDWSVAVIVGCGDASTDGGAT